MQRVKACETEIQHQASTIPARAAGWQAGIPRPWINDATQERIDHLVVDEVAQLATATFGQQAIAEIEIT
jgi:hypothetical protein